MWRGWWKEKPAGIQGRESKQKLGTRHKGSNHLVAESLLTDRSSNPSLNPRREEFRALLILCSHICTAPLRSAEQLLSLPRI